MDAAKMANRYEQAALILRVGLGAVFLIGGMSKLSLLLGSATHDGMVANYMGTAGYINTVFQSFLFPSGENSLLSPSFFLTALSTFELVSGIMLIIGFMVRPLALFYAFLLWSFVVSLPVHTVPGVEVSVKTYTSPALFVQIRDVALSGMMFTLFNLGSGLLSVDKRYFAERKDINWDNLGLLLRFSLGMAFIIAGFFGNYDKIATFATYTPLLSLIGIALIFGNNTVVRGAGAAVVAVMLWYMAQKISLDKSVIANVNGIKREFALAACGGTLLMLGGGALFTLPNLVSRTQNYWAEFRGNKVIA